MFFKTNIGNLHKNSSQHIYYFFSYKSYFRYIENVIFAKKRANKQLNFFNKFSINLILIALAVPGGDAAKDGVEVVAAQREEDGRGGGSELSGVLVALTVRVDEVANLWQQLFDQHGLIQTQAVLRLLWRNDREEESQDQRSPAG